jgi:hypothetical protein
MDKQDIFNRFEFHSATDTTGQLHAHVRQECGQLAQYLNDLLPEGREKSLAITHLEEVMFWSNAAIARNS